MPSRLVRNWPACAISAGTERSTMPPTVRRSSVTEAARARPFAEHHQHCPADEHNESQMIGEGAEVAGRKPAERLLIVARDQEYERERNPDQQDPEQATGQSAHPYRAGTGRAFMASSRRGSSSKMRLRSPSL